MERRNNNLIPSFQTPLLSSKTLTSAAASTASRLPTRRPSISGSNESSSHVPAGVTMTAGRNPSSTLRRPSSSNNLVSDASISRLPQRRPSISGESSLGYVGASGQMLPSTASRTAGTLKRTSSGAGLPQDSELSSVKRQLTKAIHTAEEVKHNYERQLLEASTSNNSLQSKMKEYSARIEKLEAHRALLSGKAREAEERETELRSESERNRTELQAQTRTLRQELSTLKDQHSNLNNLYRDLNHSASQSAVQSKSSEERMEALENEIELLREEKAESDARWLEEKEKRRAVEADFERIKIEQKDAVNSEVVREELHRQVNHLRTLEKDNQKLIRRVETYETQHANIDILKESNKTLEKKLRGMDDLRKRAATAEIQFEALEREKQEWLSFLSPSQQQIPEFSSPRKLTKTLAAAQIENATFRDRLGTHDLEMQTRDRIVGELERNVEILKKNLEESKSKLFKAESRVKQEANGHKLLEKEVEMLKRHLDTYNMEEATNQAGNFDEQKTARLVELEAHLEAHKQEVMDLSKQVAHWRGLVERYGGSTTEIVDIESRQGEDDTTSIVGRSLEEQFKKNENLQSELIELRNENSLLIKEVESLELQNDRLTYEHNNGAYDPTKTRVLQLGTNPSLVDLDLRTSTLDRLREENETLLQTIAELERRKGTLGGELGGVPMVPRTSLANLQVELDAALALVTQKETLLLRINKAFSAKADEFRKVVFSLLGYRIDFLTGGQVRVSSAYAPNKDHSLLFVSSPDGVGTMELVGAGSENGVLQNEVRNQVRFWVGERGCIPGFLASLTLTLFESTTKGSSVGFVMQD